MTVEIPLSRGLVALVDDDDADRVLAVGKWYADKSVAGVFYARKNFNRGGQYWSLKMHSFLLAAPLVDHINGDGLDNRRANLRAADPRRNSQNRGLRSDNSSGFKGVYRLRSRWVAQITDHNQRHHLGVFDSPLAAAEAYDEAARHYFGEFARLNFPLETAA